MNLTKENTPVKMRLVPNTSLQLIEIDDAVGIDVLNRFTVCCYVTQYFFRNKTLVNRTLQTCHHPQADKMREQQNAANDLFFSIFQKSFISDLQFYLFDM